MKEEWRRTNFIGIHMCLDPDFTRVATLRRLVTKLVAAVDIARHFNAINRRRNMQLPTHSTSRIASCMLLQPRYAATLPHVRARAFELGCIEALSANDLFHHSSFAMSERLVVEF